MPTFSCQVLFSASPGATPAHVRDALYEALAPYDEALEVPEYDRACHCTDGGAAPDPACPSCEGGGTYRSFYNPSAKWATILGHRGLPVSVRPVADLLADSGAEIPAAVVTPDGAWHERGGAAPGVWVATIRALYEVNRAAVAVTVDLHI